MCLIFSISQGPSWQEARSHVNPVMMKTQVVHQYTPKIGEVADDFVKMYLKIYHIFIYFNL